MISTREINSWVPFFQEVCTEHIFHVMAREKDWTLLLQKDISANISGKVGGQSKKKKNKQKHLE